MILTERNGEETWGSAAHMQDRKEETTFDCYLLRLPNSLRPAKLAIPRGVSRRITSLVGFQDMHVDGGRGAFCIKEGQDQQPHMITKGSKCTLGPFGP